MLGLSTSEAMSCPVFSDRRGPRRTLFMADMLPETKSSIGASTGWDDLMPNNAVIHMDREWCGSILGSYGHGHAKNDQRLRVPDRPCIWTLAHPRIMNHVLAHLCVWSQRSLFALRCPERFWNIWSSGQPTLLEPGWFGSERSNPSVKQTSSRYWSDLGMLGDGEPVNLKLFLDEHPFTEFTGYSWLFYGVYICLHMFFIWVYQGTRLTHSHLAPSGLWFLNLLQIGCLEPAWCGNSVAWKCIANGQLVQKKTEGLTMFSHWYTELSELLFLRVPCSFHLWWVASRKKTPSRYMVKQCKTLVCGIKFRWLVIPLKLKGNVT